MVNDGAENSEPECSEGRIINLTPNDSNPNNDLSGNKSSVFCSSDPERTSSPSPSHKTKSNTSHTRNVSIERMNVKEMPLAEVKEQMRESLTVMSP